MSALSRPAWSSASCPATADAISPLTFATAVATPLPIHASPPSRSSVASNSPVDAPDGTAARPQAPDFRATSASTVGLPRLSRIWRAWTRSMALMSGPLGAGIKPDLALGRQLLPLEPFRGGERGGPLDPPAEAVGGRPQGQLGIDAQLARDRHGGEQQVPHLVELRLAAPDGAAHL